MDYFLLYILVLIKDICEISFPFLIMLAIFFSLMYTKNIHKEKTKRILQLIFFCIYINFYNIYKNIFFDTNLSSTTLIISATIFGFLSYCYIKTIFTTKSKSFPIINLVIILITLTIFYLKILAG